MQKLKKNLPKICSEQEKIAMINSNLQRYVVLGGVIEEMPSVIQYYGKTIKAGVFLKYKVGILLLGVLKKERV